MFFSKKKIPFIIFLLSFNVLFGSLILFFAPGNQNRFQVETSVNFPGFSSLGIFNRISISLYWVLNKLFNVLSPLFVPIYLVLGLKSIQTSPKVISLMAIIIAIGLTIKNIFGIEFSIYPITSDNYLSPPILITYFSVIFTLSFIPYLIWRSYKISPKTLIYFFVLFLVLVSMFMVTLSPTMDISGNRTVFFPSMLINLLSLLLIFDSDKK